MTVATSSRAGAIARALLLLAAGAGLAALVILNPLGLPVPWAKGTAPAEAAPKTLWTCGMHPQVVQDEPGTCPICHMDLTPMRPEPAAPAEPGGRRILFYRNPMNPMVTSPVPLKDEMGMDYQPVYADEAASAGAPQVFLEPGLVQRMNVSTVPVVREDLVRTLDTVGTVEFDHATETTVTVKFRGYVERVHVHLVGEEVRRGQPLFDVYSPELVQTQQDLLSAVSYSRRLRESPAASTGARDRASDLVQSARDRLRLWDISAGQVRRVEEAGAVSRIMTVTAPASGVITEQIDNLAGMEVSPGMAIYTIADVSKAWVTAELYEDQVGLVKVHDHATVTLDAFPGESFTAVVMAMKPWVEKQTRTVQLTLALDNPGGRLRQGMYAHVRFEPVVSRAVLLVPSQAVLRTGSRNVAVVAAGDGHFEPREVTIGSETAGRLEILSGLSEGEQIVTSAQFLIDSESSLKAAVQAMTPGGR